MGFHAAFQGFQSQAAALTGTNPLTMENLKAGNPHAKVTEEDNPTVLITNTYDKTMLFSAAPMAGEKEHCLF